MVQVWNVGSDAFTPSTCQPLSSPREPRTLAFGFPGSRRYDARGLSDQRLIGGAGEGADGYAPQVVLVVVLLGVRLRHVDDERVGRHGDLGRDRGDLHRRVDLRVKAEPHLLVPCLEGPEAGQDEDDLVIAARGQIEHPEGAVASRDGRSPPLQDRRRDRHGDAGERRGGAVPNSARGAARQLGRDGAGEQAEEKAGGKKTPRHPLAAGAGPSSLLEQHWRPASLWFGNGPVFSAGSALVEGAAMMHVNQARRLLNEQVK